MGGNASPGAGDALDAAERSHGTGLASLDHAGKESWYGRRRISVARVLTLLKAYWIAFGNHGPRALPPPGENLRIFWYTMAGVGISLAVFFVIRAFAREPPRTMNKEWQEATNEYLKVSWHDYERFSATYATPGPKFRAYHRYCVGRLRGQRLRAEQVG